MARYLKQDSGSIYVWTPKLTEREDMKECDDKGVILQKVAEPSAEKPNPVLPDATPEEQPSGSGSPALNKFLLGQVKATKTVSAMVALARQNGFAFQPGMSLKEMKAAFMDEVTRVQQAKAQEEADAKAEYLKREAEAQAAADKAAADAAGNQ